MTPLLLLTLAGCAPDAAPDAGPARPCLAVRADQKAMILERVARDPYSEVLASITEAAARDYEEDEDPAIWDDGANGHNAETAQAAALLAWLHDDPEAGERAWGFFDRLESDWETHETWDINIRMPHTLIGYANALDLLQGSPAADADRAAAAAEKLGDITDAFFRDYVLDDVTRQITLGYSQNNHPIRTASAIGYAALALPDHPDRARWLDWAVSELDYLFSPEGQYVQADGGVSEGPFYYGFALSPALAFFIALEGALPDHTFHRDCINRQDIDPWAGHGCVDGEPFVFESPLYDPTFHATVDWTIALRLPDGLRPPLGDANFVQINGGPLLTSFGGGGQTTWDWEQNLYYPRDMTRAQDLRPFYLAWLDDQVPAAAPDWTSRFLPDAGDAVFRSGWETDARWMLLVAESGSARKTLHDHVDGTSFSLAAYGEYLLLDAGYYKPNELDNAVTAHADSHNVILIDGQGAPDKGLLWDFGDADATLENILEGAQLEYAEAHQDYQDTHIERGVTFVDGRYFVVADRLESDREARAHAWRLSGYAGGDLGGVFAPRADGAVWEREAAGVDVSLAALGGDLDVREPARVDWAAPHVHQFNRDRDVAHHGVIDGVVEGVSPWFLAVLAPYPTDGSAPMTVTALDLDPGVVAWSIEREGGAEVTLLREAGAPTSFVLPGGQTLETDGAFAVASLSGALGLVARGSFVAVDGEVLAAGGEDGAAIGE